MKHVFSKKALSVTAFALTLILTLSIVLSNMLWVTAEQNVNQTTEFDYFKSRLPSLPSGDYETVEGAGFTYAVPWSSPVPVISGAPVISECNREILPDESVTFSGWDFTSFSDDKKGSDTTFWIWSGKGTGTLRKMAIQQLERDIAVATVPKELQKDVYLVWVENSKGISAPVILNRAEPQWIGPAGNEAEPGQVKRLFGRSLTSTLADRRDDSSTISYVYIRSQSGGAFIPCTVQTNVQSTDADERKNTNNYELNRYNVSFTVPSSLSAGNYDVYVSNGMGGAYGFTKPVTLKVGAAFQFGTYTENLTAQTNGDNDSVRVNQALSRIAAQPNGGTLSLGAGTYYLDYQTNIIKNTRIIGAGTGQTILIINDWINLGQEGSSSDSFDNFAIEKLTIQSRKDATNSNLRMRTSNSTYGGKIVHNIKINEVSFLEGGFGIQTEIDFTAQNVEFSNSNFEWKIIGAPTDWWIHNNTFNGVKMPTQNQSDGAIGLSGKHPNGGDIGRLIIERNYAHTPNWPKDTDGNVNYEEFESREAFGERLHNTRLVHFAAHSASMVNSYIARNKTMDTGIMDNKGEIILFHSQEDPAFCKVASSTADTMTINTVLDTSLIIVGLDHHPYPATSVPNQIIYMNTSGGSIDNASQVIITAGKGRGQVRTIKSHTGTTVTVTEPFKVIPDSTSVFHITCTYMNQVVYSNELNGMPVGYKDTGHVASTGVDFDGGALYCVADSNINRRTYYGDLIQGYVCGAQSMWSVIRNSQSLDGYRQGAVIDCITNSSGTSVRDDDGNIIKRGGLIAVSGTLTLGCWIRNHLSDRGLLVTPETKGTTDSTTFERIIDGCGIENSTIRKNFYASRPSVGNYLMNFEGKTDENKLAAIAVQGYTFATIRNIVLGSSLPDPRVVSAYNSYPNYDNITSEDGKQVVFAGNKKDNTPNINYRSLHFVSDVGKNPIRQLIDIKNWGEQYSDWYIDRIEGSFIKTAISGNLFTPEAPKGQLAIGVSSAGLAAGTHFGVVFLKTHDGKSISVGVKYEIGSQYASAQIDTNDRYEDNLGIYVPPVVSSTSSSQSSQVSSVPPVSSSTSPSASSSAETTASSKSSSSKPAAGGTQSNSEPDDGEEETQTGKIVLFGTLSDGNGQPVSEKRVVIESLGVRTSTNSDGQFEFYNLTKGNYLLSIMDMEGEKISEVSVDIDFASETKLESGTVFVNEQEHAALVELTLKDGVVEISDVKSVRLQNGGGEETVKTVTTNVFISNILNTVMMISAICLAAVLLLLVFLFIRSIRREGAVGRV